ARGVRPARPGAADGPPARVPARAVHPVPRGDPGADRPPRGGRPRPPAGGPGGAGAPGAEHRAGLRPVLRRHARRRLLRPRPLGLPAPRRQPPRAGGAVSTTVEGVEAHLSGLESVWEGGMREAYAFYRQHAASAVALAAAMVESAMELQTRGGR